MKGEFSVTIKLRPPKQIIKLAKPQPPTQPAVKLTGRTHAGIDRHPAQGTRDFRENSKKGEREVYILEHTTDGRRALDKVCQERGYEWGIVRTEVTYPANGGKGKLKAYVLIGVLHEVEAGEEGSYPQAVNSALLSLAENIE